MKEYANEKTRNVSAALPHIEVDKLAALADIQDLSTAQLVRKIIREFIAEAEKKNRKQRELC